MRKNEIMNEKVQIEIRNKDEKYKIKKIDK